jgi:RNA polymerase sigma-70 factor, ECF subfamily
MDIALTEPRTAERSFEDLFADEYARLVRALYLMCGNVAEAEDLSQEALARAFERWDRVGRMDSPIGYVYRIAMNLHRRRIRREKLLRPGLPGSTEKEEATAVETRTDIMAALLALPRDLRAALVLGELLGMSSDEAGRAMGIKAGSARARLHRARAAFRERIGEGYA